MKDPGFESLKEKKHKKSVMEVCSSMTDVGGEEEIRTLARRKPATAFRVRTLRPLGYLSVFNFTPLFRVAQALETC